MDFKQGEMEFPVHLVENNTEMQQHLDENRVHFSNKCREVFQLLMSGKELTVLEALATHKISYVPRRLKDLTIIGVKYSYRWFKPENAVKYKVWFMTEADKEANRKLI